LRVSHSPTKCVHTNIQIQDLVDKGGSSDEELLAKIAYNVLRVRGVFYVFMFTYHILIRAPLHTHIYMYTHRPGPALPALAGEDPPGREARQPPHQQQELRQDRGLCVLFLPPESRLPHRIMPSLLHSLTDLSIHIRIHHITPQSGWRRASIR
jgi:hypothetical protein